MQRIKDEVSGKKKEDKDAAHRVPKVDAKDKAKQ